MTSCAAKSRCVEEKTLSDSDSAAKKHRKRSYSSIVYFKFVFAVTHRYLIWTFRAFEFYQMFQRQFYCMISSITEMTFVLSINVRFLIKWNLYASFYAAFSTAVSQRLHNHICICFYHCRLSECLFYSKLGLISFRTETGIFYGLVNSHIFPKNFISFIIKGENREYLGNY